MKLPATIRTRARTAMPASDSLAKRLAARQSPCVTKLATSLPIRAVNPLNRRDHWATRAKRANMMSHTPGPWEWTDDFGAGWMLATPDRGRLIVMDCIRAGNRAVPRFARRSVGDRAGVMVAAHDWHPVTLSPDACLIAAAPDLLAALIDMVQENQGDLTIEHYNRAREAIAKAEGRSIPGGYF